MLKTKQFNDPNVIELILRKFESYEISRSKLIIEGSSPRNDLLKNYGLIDIALDPFPFPGGTTSIEALWMGVPVLTLRGDCLLSHVGESIIQNAGLPQWIAKDLENYVELAINFSKNINLFDSLISVPSTLLVISLIKNIKL